jgi:hypothetical protein
MSANENDNPAPSRARRPLGALRRLLVDARAADDAEPIRTALIDVVDGLITHVQHQARAIDDMRSDMTHKQGIVTKIGGGEFQEQETAERLREFAASQNGDRWFLGRDTATGIAHVVHKANAPSGGAVTHIELGVFLNQGPSAPEMLGLLRLIGTLVA